MIRCEILQLEGVDNARDLGGYVGQDGRKVRHGRFFRAASLSGLTTAGRQALAGLGVSCIADLRSQMEVKKAPDAIGSTGIDYLHVPMLDYISSNIASLDFSDFPKSMGEMYVGLLERGKKGFCRLLGEFARRQGPVLFHCTAGKDRTGVTAMLLLGLAGVAEADIVEDYTYTDRLTAHFERPAFLPGYLFEAVPGNIQTAIDHVKENYGDVPTYLKDTGLTGEELDSLRAKLLDD